MKKYNNTLFVYLESGTTKKGKKYFYFNNFSFQKNFKILVSFQKLCKPENDFEQSYVYIKDFSFVASNFGKGFYIMVKEWHKVKTDDLEMSDYLIKDHSINDFMEVEDYDFN